jgi:hypothetical protein
VTFQNKKKNNITLPLQLTACNSRVPVRYQSPGAVPEEKKEKENVSDVPKIK